MNVVTMGHVVQFSSCDGTCWYDWWMDTLDVSSAPTTGDSINVTHDEAVSLKSFKSYCICGGFAHSMNGRNPADPHMEWCPQKEEYKLWYKAMHSQPEQTVQKVLHDQLPA